jgi:hypothetical protein
MVSGGIKVKTRPIKKMMAIISPSIFPIMPFDFFIAANVFFLSFINEIAVSTIAMTQNAIVNISILALLLLICSYYSDKIIKKVLPM